MPKIEGENQFFDDEEDQGWSVDTDPLEKYEGLEYDILSFVDLKGAQGVSLQDIYLMVPQDYTVGEVGETIQSLCKRKILNQFKGQRYFIGVL